MTTAVSQASGPSPSIQWIRFPDGGSYIGPVSYGLAQGLAVSVGPREAGEYAGFYQGGYETLGVFKLSRAETKLSSGTVTNSYAGEWSDGRRHGLGVDFREGWIFRGEWNQGFRGRYGVRQKSDTTVGYEGTWTSGVQDGFGVESYGDGSWYSGQWMKGMRHGYGVRQSAAFQSASKYRAVIPTPQSSSTSQSKRFTLLKNPANTLITLRDQKILNSRGGFVLLADPSISTLPRKRGLLLDRHGRPSLSKTISHRIRELTPGGTFSRTSSFRSVGGRQTGGSVRSTVGQEDFALDDDSASFISVEINSSNILCAEDLKEAYFGEWKDDRRNGYGVCQRTDGLKYEGEWLNNQKHGYGCTTLPNGTKLSGKYRHNILITSVNSKGMLAPFRGNKILDRITFAVEESQRAARHSQEKQEIARTRMLEARERAAAADDVAARAAAEAEVARVEAARFMSNHQSSTDVTVSMHRPSELEFYAEIDPTDRDFSMFHSHSIKKKRFPLSIGRPRTGSLSAVNEEAGVADFPSNKISIIQRPHSQMDPVRNIEFNAEPLLDRHQFQPAMALGSGSTVKHLQQPARYTFEPSHQTTVNRLSSVPAFNHSNGYGPSEISRARRKSLPSIVKEKIVEEVNPESLYDASIDPDLTSFKKSTNSKNPATVDGKSLIGNQLAQPKQNVKRIDTYIIENGVRKLVKKTRESPKTKRLDTKIKPGGALSLLIKSSFQAASAAPRAHVSVEEQFDDMYKTESPDSAWKKGRGSIPDITTALNTIKIPPREEVYVLSQRRREEIIQERAERERIRKNHIVLSLIDMKRWFTQHIVLVCFLFINVLMAAVLLKS